MGLLSETKEKLSNTLAKTRRLLRGETAATSIQIRTIDDYRSPIREILEYSSKPDILSMAGGAPSYESIADAVETVANIRHNFSRRPEAIRISNYLPARGYKPFLEEGSRLFREKGIEYSTPERVVPSTNGSQGILGIFAENWIRKGDIVIMDGPTYPGIVAASWKRKPEYWQIGMDDQGTKPDDLKAALKRISNGQRNKRVTIYLMPSGHNPKGITMPEERRKEIAAVIQESGLSSDRLRIIVDAPYDDINLSEKPTPTPLGTYLSPDITWNVTTASKIGVPDERVAWADIPEDDVTNYVCERERQSLFGSDTTLAAFTEFSTSGKLKEHIKHVNNVYKKRFDTMLECLNEYKERCGWEWINPSHGMFFYVTVPDVNTRDLFYEGVKRGVAFVPGDGLYVAPTPDKREKNEMRLCFASLSEQDLKKAMEILGNLIIETKNGI